MFFPKYGMITPSFVEAGSPKTQPVEPGAVHIKGDGATLLQPTNTERNDPSL